jgi:endonuclease-3
MNKIKDILNITSKIYDDIGTSLAYETDFQLVVAVMLSARCTDKRVNIVTKELFKTLKTAEDFYKIELSKLEKYVFSTGFYKNKAKNIKLCANEILNVWNGIIPNNINDLVKLSGIGRKSANVILGELFNKSEGVVVDTHIYRVSKRLGLSNGNNAITVEKDLISTLNPKDWIRYGNFMIQHGRAVCHSRKPNCQDCKLSPFCKYYLNKKV